MIFCVAVLGVAKVTVPGDFLEPFRKWAVQLFLFALLIISTLLFFSVYDAYVYDAYEDQGDELLHPEFFVGKPLAGSALSVLTQGVSLQNVDSSKSVQLLSRGELVIEHMSLKAVHVKSAAPYLKYGLMGLWGMAGLYLCSLLLRSWQGVGVVLLGAGIVVLMVMPHTYKALLMQYLQNHIFVYMPDMGTKIPVYIQEKLGHFFAYFLFSLVVFVVFKKNQGLSLVLLGLLAAATEVLQFFAIQRGALWFDFLINFSGVALAACVLLILRLKAIFRV